MLLYVHLNSLTLTERYKVLLENGVDLYLGITVGHGTAFDASLRFPNFPDAIIAGVESGEIDKILVDRAAARLLRTKFEQDQNVKTISFIGKAKDAHTEEDGI